MPHLESIDRGYCYHVSVVTIAYTQRLVRPTLVDDSPRAVLVQWLNNDCSVVGFSYWYGLLYD